MYNEYNNGDTKKYLVQIKCEPQPCFAGYKCTGEQMLLATLLATNKCVGGQMLVKIYLFGGRFFVRNEVIMKVESGKFYFIKDEFFDVFKGYKLMDNKENGNKRPYKIKDNFKFDFEQEMTNLVDLADCYFRIGNEEKARGLMLEFIKKNPDEDEPHQCMQIWYMYDSPSIDKLAEVIDLAEKNGHVLITDFGYDRLVKYYEMIGDTENQQKYQELYDKWKDNKKN